MDGPAHNSNASTNQHHHSGTHLVCKPHSSRFCRTVSAFSSLPTVPQKRRLLSPSFANVFMVFNAEPPVCDFKNVHLREKQKQKVIKNLNFINIRVFYNLRFLGIPLNARQFLRTTFTQIICFQIEPFKNVIRTRFTVSRCKTEIQQNISKRN